MKAKFLSLLIVLSIIMPAVAQRRKPITKVPAPAAQTNKNLQNLPIKRVVLYSNGVAYIERRGIVSGDAEINLSFKQSQVDDILKSMVVLDLGEGRIGAVSYNSSLPVSSRTAEIPFAVAPQTGNDGGIAGVLAQLQGAKVVVSTSKTTATGSILTVEKRTTVVEANKLPVTSNFLVINTEAGEISSFDLADVKGVKLLDEGTRKDVSEFTSAAASARRRDAKTISVTSRGSREREMVVSYTISAPIWKTTYRVVLDTDGKPFFQGWAIVDNVSEEDWQNVQLSLISGTPVSFIQPIQNPMYRYRPVVPIPQDLNLRPQIYEEGTSVSPSTISGTIYDQAGSVIPNASVSFRNINGQNFSTRSNSNGSFSSPTLSNGVYTVTASASGFQTLVVSGVVVSQSGGRNLNLTMSVGTVSETVTIDSSQSSISAQYSSGLRSNNSFVVDGASNNFIANNIIGGATTSVSEALTSNNSGVETAATGSEVGDLFEYKIAQPVTVLRDKSALIPIIQTKMEGERIAIYNEGVRADRPMGGMLLENTTALTFEGGSLTVLDKDTYAGEALMERLKPKERRLISFALDLGTLVTTEIKEDKEPAKLVKILNGVFQVHYFQSSRKIYNITNQTDKVKTLYIEYPVRNGWELSPETPKPDITTQRYHRFRVELKPFEKTGLTISERRALMDGYQLTSLTYRDLELFLTKRYIDDSTRAKLQKIIDLRTKINQIQQKLEALEDEEENIADDQKRLRENIETLSKTPEAKTLITRYVEKVNSQETRLETILKEKETLDAETRRLSEDLSREIRDFEL